MSPAAVSSPSSASTGKIRGFAAKGKGQALEPWEYTPRPLGPHDIEIKIDHCGIC
ncbi:hypothetical protein IWQ60_012573, partial [Tieghemiomyces parasiticus]